jgi:RNA polymerase sigma factor (sigma-70 family)
VSEQGGQDVWRGETPYVLTALLRRSSDFEACEDAVQEALLAATRQWPSQGRPDDPRAWLIRVASRKLIDEQRRRQADAAREQHVAGQGSAADLVAPSAETEAQSDRPGGDDTLALQLLCAHPALSEASQVALTLRAVAGLSTAQIAAVFLVPEATMAQRISRAKATIRATGARLQQPTLDDLPARLHAVRHVLYLTFTAGHTAAAGPHLLDLDLAAEAIRLAERLHRALPHDFETAGLLALMLLTHARTPARLDADGDLVPLGEQDRTLWDDELIARGTHLVEAALPVGDVGPLQLQAAIAAVHAEATTAADTDWLQITMLYRMLDRAAPSPAVTLGLAVAVGMAHGPQAGLAALAPLLERDDQRRNHRVHAAQAHLLELAGERAAARTAYALAARLTQSLPEQRYLNSRSTR